MARTKQDKNKAKRSKAQKSLAKQRKEELGTDTETTTGSTLIKMTNKQLAALIGASLKKAGVNANVPEPESDDEVQEKQQKHKPKKDDTEEVAKSRKAVARAEKALGRVRRRLGAIYRANKRDRRVLTKYTGQMIPRTCWKRLVTKAQHKLDGPDAFFRDAMWKKAALQTFCEYQEARTKTMLKHAHLLMNEYKAKSTLHPTLTKKTMKVLLKIYNDKDNTSNVAYDDNGMVPKVLNQFKADQEKELLEAAQKKIQLEQKRIEREKLAAKNAKKKEKEKEKAKKEKKKAKEKAAKAAEAEAADEDENMDDEDDNEDDDNNYDDNDAEATDDD
jgi:hypothetical protein